METSETLALEIYRGKPKEGAKIHTKRNLPIIENLEEIARKENVLRSFTPNSKRSHEIYDYVLGEDVRTLKRNGRLKRREYKGFRKTKRFINGHSLNVLVRI
jgi:hypothetical protein